MLHFQMADSQSPNLQLLFWHQVWWLVFRWNLSNTKFPPVSRTLLNILIDFNCVVVWMVLILPLISCSPSFSPKPLHNSQWITFPTLSYLLLYFFCGSVLHSRCYYYYYHCCWESFTEVWMIKILFMFPGLFSVLWLI